MNTDFSLDKITRESRHTRELHRLLQTSLPWAGKTRNMNRLCCKKVEQLTTFFRSMQQHGLLQDVFNCG